MEKTLVLIKPDAVEKNIIGKIITAYEEANLKVVSMKMGIVEKSLAEKHYEEHKEKSFYPSLIDFITRSPLCALILEGNDCIEKVRRINGATNPRDQVEGTIRQMYANGITENCVHASDCKENAEKEIRLWFSEVI